MEIAFENYYLNAENFLEQKSKRFTHPVHVKKSESALFGEKESPWSLLACVRWGSASREDTAPTARQRQDKWGGKKDSNYYFFLFVLPQLTKILGVSHFLKFLCPKGWPARPITIRVINLLLARFFWAQKSKKLNKKYVGHTKKSVYNFKKINYVFKFKNRY